MVYGIDYDNNKTEQLLSKHIQIIKLKGFNERGKVTQMHFEE